MKPFLLDADGPTGIPPIVPIGIFALLIVGISLGVWLL